MSTRWVRLLFWALPATVLAQSGSVHSILPPKNVLALTPENFCLGFKNVFAITKQSFKDEANLICPNLTPAPLLTTLLASAYTGVGEPVIQNILIAEDTVNLTSQITVAYALKIPKPPAQNLLGEEQYVPTSYSVEPLTITPKFAAPVLNSGDAETAFTVEQRTVVDAGEEFDDISVHDLKLYRMHPNNFDFFAAVRTLRAPSEQFKKAVVVRGVMRDPANPTGSITVTVMSFVMNSRDNHENSVEAFSAFIAADAKSLHAAQSK